MARTFIDTEIQSEGQQVFSHEVNKITYRALRFAKITRFIEVRALYLHRYYDDDTNTYEFEYEVGPVTGREDYEFAYLTWGDFKSKVENYNGGVGDQYEDETQAAIGSAFTQGFSSSYMQSLVDLLDDSGL